MICKKCGQDKDRETAFYKRETRDGRRIPRHECIECKSKRSKEYLANLPPEKDKIRRQKMNLRQRNYAENHPFYWMAKQIRARCRKSGTGYDPQVNTKFLEALWSNQKGLCALTGKPMLFAVEERGFDKQMDRVSVDRIDPKIGYTPANVQLVRAGINIAKNARTQREFIEMCRDVVRYWEGREDE